MMTATALVCSDREDMNTALVPLLAEAGYAVRVFDPATLADDAAWEALMAGTGDDRRPLALLVHAVASPDAAISALPGDEFERLLERVTGSLWQSGTRAAERMQACAGGTIVVVLPSGKGLAPVFADGLRALANCLGVAYATPERTVRAVSLSDGGKDASTLGELVVFLGSEAASYISATEISCQ